MGVNHPGLNLFANIPPLPTKTTGRVYFAGNSSTYVPGGVAGVDAAGVYGDNPQKPFATIDYAVGQCTANRGDLIIALPGHVEDVTAAAGLDLDVAGITIYFLGEGSNRATIRFSTAAGADMDVDAADITLGEKGYDLGPRFLANVDALTGPIDVNAARFKMYGAKWYDGTSINTTDCVVADANADNMVIEDFEFVDGDAAGTQKQSFIQVAGATGVIIRKVKCTGDFGTGIIENGTAWVDALLEDLVLDNASTSPTVCLLLQATSTGWVRNSSLRVASGTTGYTANNDMQFDNVAVTGTDASAVGTSAIGATADSAATGAVTTTDTLMAYIKQLVTQNGVELDTDTLGALLAGTSGIATMPNAAVPANNVNMFELLRSIWGNLCGTASGENGIATFPTAAAPANNVSLAEVVRAIYDAVAADGTATTTVHSQLGRRVTKVGDVASSPDPLFTITGKNLITLIVGEVTSVIASTTSLHLRTSSNTQNLCISTDISSDAAGTLYLVTGDPDDTLNGAVATVPNVDIAWSRTGFHAPFLMNDDEIIQTIDGAGTGTIQWDLYYIPLEASASITSTA